MKLAKTRLLRYAYMRLAREFDARFERMLKTGRITKWYSAIGNEAVTVPAGLALEPGVVTAVAGRAEVAVDLRHPDSGELGAMLGDVRDAAGRIAAERDCGLAEHPIWSIEPIPFDPALVRAAEAAASRAGGRASAIASGALHDAAEMARRVPVAMVFAASVGGISHAREEDSRDDDLRAAIAAYGALAGAVLTEPPGTD